MSRNSSMDVLRAKNSASATFQDLTENMQEYIFGTFLNFTDLKNCRLVSRQWNLVISLSESLRKQGFLRLSLGHHNQSIMKFTQVKWDHIRFELFVDYQNQELSPEEIWKELPNQPFNYVQTLEFKQCYFMSWLELKQYVIMTPLLQHLILRRCIFKDDPIPDGLPPDKLEQFLIRMNSLKSVSVHDVAEVYGITEVLEKLLFYSTTNLETIKIDYRTSFHVRRPLAVRFLQLVADLILLNKGTLRNLNLNIRNSEILNNFGEFVLGPMEPFFKTFQLRVLKLAQPLPDVDNATINMESAQFLTRFGQFLATQKGLLSLAFPHLENLSVAETRRWSILDQTTKNIQKLRIPGAMYLRRNALKSFSNLEVLFIGEKTLGSAGTILNPTKFNMDRGGLARRNIAKVKEISIYSNVNYQTGNLFHILEKFPNLVVFEFNGLRPVFNDKDLQAIIKHVPRLRKLSITYCEYITDEGVTGIPLETCQDLLRYATIYIEDIDERKMLATAGAPLSNLKSLLSLQLIGKSRITDVGIRLGISFSDLRKIHIPYGTRITHWGIEQLGKQNPCLESIILTGATEETTVGLATVVTTHKRLLKDRCKVQNIKELNGEFIHPTLLHGVLWNTLP